MSLSEVTLPTYMACFCAKNCERASEARLLIAIQTRVSFSVRWNRIGSLASLIIEMVLIALARDRYSHCCLVPGSDRLPQVC